MVTNDATNIQVRGLLEVNPYTGSGLNPFTSLQERCSHFPDFPKLIFAFLRLCVVEVDSGNTKLKNFEIWCHESCFPRTTQP